MTTEQHANQPSPVNPQAVEDTKQQIRALVGEIAQLTRKEVEPEIFYAEFLQRVITALAAVGGAVWLLKDGHELRLTYQVNIRQAFPEDNSDDQARHGRLLQRVMTGGEHLLVPPYSGTTGEDEAGNPTSFLLVLAPIKDDDKVAGIVEIFQRPTSGPASQRGYLRFLSEMCQHIGDYLRSRRLRELNDWQSLSTEIARFSLAVHESLDPSTTAYTIANEGRRLISCDRVSVALRKGRKCTVKAVSGQDTMDTRSNAVVLLSKLATAVMRSGEPLWYTGSSEDLPPQIENALHDYVDETHTKTVAVIPLRKPSEEVPDGDESKKKRKRSDNDDVIGTLIVEQIEDSRAPEEFTQSVDMVCHHSARAMANAVEHDTLFLMPVWRAIGNAKWIIEARTLPKTFAVLAAVGLVVAILCFYPRDFDMEAPGTLEPVERRNVFIEVDGTVSVVHVEHDQAVKKGQLLLEMTNPSLDTSREELTGEIQAKADQIRSTGRQRGIPGLTPVDRNQLDGQITQLTAEVESLQKQLALVNEQIGMLKVTSPIDGIVISWDNRDQLSNRPLVRGQVAMSIADVTQEWEIEAYMEEDRMGHVARALPDNGESLEVKYILKADPKNQLMGTLAPTGIHDAAQLHDVHGHSVRMRIDINEEDLDDPKTGSEVTIKVKCGRRSVGYVWFHELVEFIQSTLLF